MAIQITLNQFNALTLIEKYEMFGSYFFTAKQCTIIKSMLDSNCNIDSVDLMDNVNLNKRSIGQIISSLNRKIHQIIDIDYEWTGESISIYNLDEDALKREFCIDNLIEMGAISLIEDNYLEAGKTLLRKVKHLSLSYDEEKTQNETVRNLAVSIGENNFKEADEILIELDEWVKETLKKRADLEEEKEQLKKGAKRLKASTIKAYSESQLRRHLDRLQDCFIDPLYRLEYGEVYKYEKEENGYFYFGKSKAWVIRAINHSYRELGI